ncbi:MAG TPA: hypothetical protein VF630_11770 [Hymenobacter sp.]|jgi:hypothetical protein
MARTSTTSFLTFCFFLLAFASQAQYALTSIPRRADVATAPAPGAPTKAVAYKLVHGVVQGADGALAGATVWLDGTRTIVVTNSEGEFELRVPTTAKQIKLTCGYGGLHEEEVTLAPVQALGSIYLLRRKTANAKPVAAN